MQKPIEIIASVEDWVDHPPHTISQYHAEQIIEALESAGFLIVPKEPTEKMILAAIESGFEGNERHIVQDWRAMIAAAPR